MSAVIEAVSDVWDAVIEVAEKAWEVVEFAVVDITWKYFFVEPLRLTMSLFGITDEDIISTEVLDQRLIPDSDRNLMVEVALEHQSSNKGIIEIFMVKAAQIRGSFNGYFTNGKDNFTDGLPTTNIRSEVVDKAAIKTAIDSDLGVNSTVSYAAVKLPTATEYLYYYMTKNYQYKAWLNIFYNPATSYWTKIDYHVYSAVSNTYNVYHYIDSDRHIKETKDTVVTVASKDKTTDTVTTTVTIHHIKEWKLKAENGFAVIPDPAETYNTVTVTTADVPKGSVSPSSVPGVLLSESYSFEKYLPNVLTGIPGFHSIRYFVARYILNSGEWNYWVYDPNAGTYPALTNESKVVSELEMLPVVKLRGSAININEDKESVRYLESKELLKVIGIDVDNMIESISANPDIDNIEDAFIHFAIDPNDQDPVVQKIIYQMFDYLYSNTSVVQDDASYLMTFKESDYNIAVSWRAQQRNDMVGTIGAIGTYKSIMQMESVSIDAGEYGTVTEQPTLICQYQDTATTYVEYKISGLVSMTYIERNGLVGLVAKDVTQEGFLIPLSKYFIDQMSPMEQHTLFKKALRLAIYAATITHLEWYETEAFGLVLQIVAIAIAIFTLGSATGVSAFLWALATMAAMYAAAYAISILFDNPFLRAIATVVMIAIAAHYGLIDVSNLQMLFTTADQLTTATTEYFNEKSQKLAEEFSIFSEKVETKMKELEDLSKELIGGLSTEFVQQLATVVPISPYILGVDAMIYGAVQQQYDFDRAKTGVYGRVYDYDIMYRVGMV